MNDPRRWYVDSSVILRAAVDQSSAARAWMQQAIRDGDVLVASRLMELEVTRVAMNIGYAAIDVAPYFDDFLLAPLDDGIVDEALALPGRLGGADAIHIAVAMRLGPGAVTIVTHDRQMAVAAHELGFDVLDPVADDPGRGPVTAGL